MTSDELGISPSDREMALSARPEALRLKVNETVLIVVDMQNAYVSRGGYLDLAGFDISGAAAVVEQTGKAIEAAHHAGIPVTFLQNGWDANYVEAGGPGSPNWHKSNALKTMRRRPELAGQLLARGGWDYEVVEALKPHEDDIIVSKPRYSGFCNTNLDSLLRARGIRNLVFTGIATNICVESTLRDGFFLEYFGIILSDAVGRAGPDFVQKAALYNIETFFGWVSTVAEFTDALEKAGVIYPEASHVKRIV